MKMTTHQMEEIIGIVKGQPNGEEALDELVHDAKSDEAADINNAGTESQLTYLASWFGSFEKFKAFIESV